MKKKRFNVAATWKTLPNRQERRIVVASTGRAGSTLLYNSILRAYGRARWGFEGGSREEEIYAKRYRGFVSRINSHTLSSSPVVIKTHDLCPDVVPAEALFIFLHGDPLEAAISVRSVVDVKGVEWFYKHQHHLHGEGGYSSLFQRDVLNFRGQIKSWLSRTEQNVFCVSYETLWEQVENLEEFLGFDIQLPARRERSKRRTPIDINYRLFEELRALRKEYENRRRRGLEGGDHVYIGKGQPYTTVEHSPD